MIKYEDRGVSPHKPDVKNAIKKANQGLWPNAFCKAVPDIFTDSSQHCILLHADGAGTKSNLAYIHYKKYKDPNIFEGIAQDSLVMNLDDLLCVGATGSFILSNTIGRDAKLIDGKVITSIIHGYTKLIKKLKSFGIEIVECGGETADVGDLVRTIIVDATLITKMLRKDFIDCSLVKENQYIIGLASYGKSIYEDEYNSGIGANGFTSVRHELFKSNYKEQFPETFSPSIYNSSYTGKFDFEDKLPGTKLTIGKALLSPTRTYAPIFKSILPKYKENISAIFHNSGGGQTKCLNFGSNINYIKDNLFPPPPIFKFIKKQTNLSQREMYRVFNMGHRLEIVCEPQISSKIIDICKQFNVDARIIGRTKKSSTGNSLTITTSTEIIEYK